MHREIGILVVAQSIELREAIGELLEENGFEVAFQIREARTVRPSLILLDAVQIDDDGAAFFERQRADPSLVNVPIVVMTASRGPCRSLPPGARVLLEPFDALALLDMVGTALRRERKFGKPLPL